MNIFIYSTPHLNILYRRYKLHNCLEHFYNPNTDRFAHPVTWLERDADDTFENTKLNCRYRNSTAEGDS